MRRYLKVHWHHELNDEPVVLYHELDSSRIEVRRIEEFADGHLQYSDRADPDAPTSVSFEPLPRLEEIRVQPEFSVTEIDRPTFEEVWDRARQT